MCTGDPRAGGRFSWAAASGPHAPPCPRLPPGFPSLGRGAARGHRQAAEAEQGRCGSCGVTRANAGVPTSWLSCPRPLSPQAERRTGGCKTTRKPRQANHTQTITWKPHANHNIQTTTRAPHAKEGNSQSRLGPSEQPECWAAGATSPEGHQHATARGARQKENLRRESREEPEGPWLEGAPGWEPGRERTLGETTQVRDQYGRVLITAHQDWPSAVTKTPSHRQAITGTLVRGQSPHYFPDFYVSLKLF